MKRVDDPGKIFQWGYFDQRLGKGYAGTKDQIILQVGADYVKANIEFGSLEIPARIEDWMCEQGLAGPCSEYTAGLGDLIHRVVQPIAQVIDHTFGTKYTLDCPACGKRQEALNKMVPFQ